MNFVVAYRDPKGNKVEGEFSAANRNELFTVLAAKGISAISIREGTMGPASKKHSSGGSGNGVFKGIIALVIVLLIGAVVWFFVSSPAPRKPKGKVEIKKSAQIAEAEPVKVEPKEVEEVNEVVGIDPNTNKSLVGRVVTNSYGKTFTIAREVKHDFVMRKDGVEYRERSLFHNEADKFLDIIVNAEPGVRILATFNSEKFRQALQNSVADKIEFTDEDTEDDRIRKENVIAARQELFDAIKRGEDPVEITRRALIDANEIADKRDNIVSSLAEFRRTAETEQEVNDYIAAANKLLEPLGVKPLLTPAETKERVRRSVLRRQMEGK